MAVIYNLARETGLIGLEPERTRLLFFCREKPGPAGLPSPLTQMAWIQSRCLNVALSSLLLQSQPVWPASCLTLSSLQEEPLVPARLISQAGFAYSFSASCFILFHLFGMLYPFHLSPPRPCLCYSCFPESLPWLHMSLYP